MRTARAVIVVAVLLAVAATSAAAPPKLVGTWELVDVKTPSSPSSSTAAQGEMLWTFAAEGGFTATASKGKETRTTKGTWKANGKILTVTDGEHGQDLDYVLDGTTLTVTNREKQATLRFKRQGTHDAHP